MCRLLTVLCNVNTSCSFTGQDDYVGAVMQRLLAGWLCWDCYAASLGGMIMLGLLCSVSWQDDYVGAAMQRLLAGWLCWGCYAASLGRMIMLGLLCSVGYQDDYVGIFMLHRLGGWLWISWEGIAWIRVWPYSNCVKISVFWTSRSFRLIQKQNKTWRH